MPKYNRKVRTKKYSDEFKSTATISRGTKAERFQFLEQHRGRLKMALLYKQLNVSKSGFYHWLKREESERHKADQRLLIHITGIFIKSQGIYRLMQINLLRLINTGHQT